MPMMIWHMPLMYPADVNTNKQSSLMYPADVNTNNNVVCICTQMFRPFRPSHLCGHALTTVPLNTNKKNTFSSPPPPLPPPHYPDVTVADVFKGGCYGNVTGLYCRAHSYVILRFLDFVVESPKVSLRLLLPQHRTETYGHAQTRALQAESAWQGVGERECRLLVLDSVTSTPQWIRHWSLFCNPSAREGIIMEPRVNFAERTLVIYVCIYIGYNHKRTM